MNDLRSGGLSIAQILRILMLLGVLAVVGWLIYTIRGTLLPFAIAFVLSYLLLPVVDYLESRRINRYAAVAGVLICLLALVLVPLRYGVPVLLSGTEDMMQRIAGQQGQWACVVANLNASDEPVWIERLESSREDFKIEGLTLPRELAPGERDTLHVVFTPETASERTGMIRLDLQQGEFKTNHIRLRLKGNVPDAPDSASLALSRQMTFGSVKIALSDTAHAFGKFQPGYLAILKSYNRNLQKRMGASVPMLKGIDFADNINAKLQNMVTDFLQKMPEIAGRLLSGATYVIIVPLVLFFFLCEGRAIKRALIEMVPNAYFEMVLNLLYRIDLQLGGYIRGMVLSVIIISSLSAIGLYAVGLEYFLVIGIIAGVANIIPYLGPLIGIIAGLIAVALQYSSLTLSIILPVVVVFLIVQLCDNVFVAPVVVARSVNLHPLLVIFVVLVGSQLFGAVGMLLAVPATAVIKVSVQTVAEGLRSYSV